MALSNKEAADINRLLVKLVNDFVPKNIKKDQYYEANTDVKSLNVSSTSKQATLKTVSGWGRTVVNTRASRVRIEEVDTNGLDDLSKIIKENRLVQKSSEVHKDCYIYGTAYVLVTEGKPSVGEPEILITAESPYTTIGEENPRTNRLDSLLKVYTQDGKLLAGSYYTPNEVIFFNINDGTPAIVGAEAVPAATLTNYDLSETSRNTHNLGFIPAKRFANDVRASNRKGQSLITSSVRYFIDAINRTYQDIEWNNNFYAFPKRFLSGVDLDRYKNEDGTVNSQALSSFMKDVWLVSKETSEDGTTPSATPQVGQLSAGSSEPYIAVVKLFASEIARESLIPEYYLNAGSDIPTAAEAMQASEHPLNLACEEDQIGFGNDWVDVFRIAMLMKRKSVPDEFFDVEIQWKDTSTISLAARADALTKLIQSKAIPANSPAILTFIPWTATQKKAIAAYQTAADTVESRNALAAAIREFGAQLVPSDPAVVASANTVTVEE